MLVLKDILAGIATAIVNTPDEVNVTETIDADGSVVLVLSVAPDDMGMVIGKNGKIAKAIRSIMKTAANIDKRKVTVEIK